ncbi:MAG TPA: hypothetical protein VLQ91_00655 [Draconibacterium sp.]|nr:hypothetical protein [Draconibacterium sp.]
MIKIKGTLNAKGEVVFQRGKPLPLKTLYQQQTLQLPVEISIELSVTVELNSLISGTDGFVWATKDICQAEIITNALKIQHIESEIINTESNNISIYLIKVNREDDINEGFDFIQNDKSGLRLKPDWNYPDGEPNQSFEQWINE